MQNALFGEVGVVRWNAKTNFRNGEYKLRNLIIGSVLLSLAGSIWGAMFIAVRLTVGVITPVALVWMRYGIALVPLVLIMLHQRISWKIERRD